MDVIDKNFSRKRVRCTIQSIFAFLMMAISLLLLHFASQMGVLEAIGASSLASSICIAFTMPSSPSAKPCHLIGGYTVALVIGMLCYGICVLWMHFFPGKDAFFNSHFVCAALAVAAAIFVMVLFNVTHPPAAGFALGLVIERWDLWTVIILGLAIVLLAAVRYVMKPILIDLV